ncbi:MAG: radical SAM protein [Desulfobacteraceae bacterium]|nr:radical SAM protein [Desulfobacteraceae bacterium]
MNLEQHPCFNRKSHHHYGRVHLPVAPRCNIQCKFCNRLFDCVNESRPGVTSALLSPAQAMVYLAAVLEEKPNIKVVGIAGPGDPFANAEQTLETFERVRRTYPDMMLCVASNGLNIAPYVEELHRLQVSHVTITVNAVDPAIGANIYSWMRIGKRVVSPEEGARILLERQMEAIKALKSKEIMVKVNAIVLPGINEEHIVDIARTVAPLGVDLFNGMPYYPNKGSAFEHLAEPDSATMAAIRKQAGQYLPQMSHCTRCRADAVGLLGEAPSPKLMQTLNSCQHLSEPPAAGEEVPTRPYVAVASMEGVLVNQHLGEAGKFLIYEQREGRIRLVESRPAPEPGGGLERWRQLAERLGDCRMLLVSGAGENPRKVLADHGVAVALCEGLIEEAVHRVFAGQSLSAMAVRKPRACGVSCGGDMMGC